MKALALRVARRDGERRRRELLDQGLLRTDLGIERDPDCLYLPLAAPPTELGPDESVEEREFPNPVGAAARSYRDLLELSEEIERKLPRAFDVVGDIVLVRLPPEVAPHAAAIGRALLEFVPSARLVAEDRGVKGTTRIRDLRVLAGSGPFRTEHHENGLSFTVDLKRVYFSPRLAREHAAVADQVGDGEKVLDLCCGVGPFARTIVDRHPNARVTAVDLNPAAIELLREDLTGSPGAAAIEAVCERAEEFLSGAGPFDRAVLNLPHGGREFLGALGPHLGPRGVVHYYEVVERAEVDTRSQAIPRELGPPGRFDLVEQHVVHEYSPRSDLRAYTLRASIAGS